MCFRKLKHPASMSHSASLSVKEYGCHGNNIKMIQCGLKSSIPSAEWACIVKHCDKVTQSNVCLKY